jgi:hypothetical protein
MPESLGARLRRQREEQNIALVTIAEQTKIKASLLEALERDDVSRWPSGIFRRAYVRAYADAIGLNPDDVLREFLEKYPDPADDVDPLAAIATSDSSPAAGGPPTRFHYLVDSARASLSRVRRSSVSAAPVTTGHPRIDVPGEPTRTPDEHPVGHLTRVTSESDPVGQGDGTVVPEPAIAQAAMPVITPNAGTDRATDTSPAHQAARDASRYDPACNELPAHDPDLVAFSNLCSELAQIENADEMQPLIQKAAGILEAAGLIVWLWDQAARELVPALVHGYSDQVVAQLPAVTEHADNITAAAFRSAEACTTGGSEHENGALVVPLLTPAGCRGVLALELRRGRERANSVRALATIFAAMLAQLVGEGGRGEVRQPAPMTVPGVGEHRRRVFA